MNEIETDLNNPATSVRTAQLLSTLDTFLGGHLVTVGRRNDKHAYFKQLEPSSQEVWEIRSVDPKPSIRLFGRFALSDVFIATNKAHRNQLGGYNSKEFKSAINICMSEWRKFFQTWPPHTGKSVNEYITHNAVDISSL